MAERAADLKTFDTADTSSVSVATDKTIVYQPLY